MSSEGPKPGEGVPAPIVAPVSVGVTLHPSDGRCDVRIAPNANMALVTLALSRGIQTVQEDILNRQAAMMQSQSKVQVASASTLRAIPK